MTTQAIDPRETYVRAITQQLTERLCPTRLDVLDESADHAGHVGANAEGFGTHVRVRIASPAFAGKTRVAKHQIGRASCRERV